MNKLIFGALGFLVFLIFITILFTSSFKKKQQTQTAPITPFPTQFVERPGGAATGFSSKELQDKALVEKQGKVFSQDQLNRVNEFEKKIPFSSPYFDIASSEATGEFFAEIKTPQGGEKLEEFIEENGLTDVKQDFDYLFQESKTSLEQQLLKAEDELVKARLKQAFESQDEELAPTGGKKNQLDYLIESGLTLFSFNFGGPKEEQPAGKGGTGLIANPTVLDQIFNEAGSKVGTPPKMLKAIMSIECGRLLNALPDEIVQYTAPGAGLPPNHGCYRNRGGYPAFGPMQFVPGTFTRYGSAVNRFGGYSHSPSIQNIRDSVYAAAELFLLNSGATGGIWTAEQIKRAYVCYAAGCRQYDRGRLGTDTQRLLTLFLQRYNSY